MTAVEQLAFLRTILQSATEYSIVAADLNAKILAWNEGAHRIYGYEPEEVIGKSALVVLHHPEDVASGRARAIMDEARTAGKWSGELRRIRKDGSTFPALVTITLRRSADGSPAGFTMISQDLTESRRILDELTESREYNRGLIESNIDALMTTDRLGIITDVNRQMCDMAGSPREALIGSPFKDHFTDPNRAEEGIRRVLADDRLTNYELTMRSRQGRETMVSYNATTFRSATGKLKGVFAAARDITAQKRLEERLQRKNKELQEQNRKVQEANRLKSEFLANMSHELRTPLNAIIGFSELLHDGKAGAVSAKQKGYARDILISGRHLLELINDVLDLSKVESGKMEFFPEPIDPGRIVSEVRDILRTLTARKRIRLKTEIDPELRQVVLDPAKLKQVLFNFLSNALKFTPEEGRVTIRMRAGGADDLLLEVADTGIGIRPADLPRLFVEFEQLDASASKKFQGTGLGLALTKRIVEAQGGSVGVVSAAGKGSTFSARLPRMAVCANPAPDTGLIEPAPAAGAHRVLVIEDDPGDRKWLTTVLAGAGYAVHTAATGAEALRALGKHRFDAMTMDLMLPDMSGWDVLRKVRAGGPNRDVPVVVVTVLADGAGGVGFAIRDFLEKPVREHELLRALSRARARAGGDAVSVLLVDDNRRDLKLFQSALKQNGYSTIAKSSALAALRVANEKPPDVVVLDLVMPRLDGFEFLRRFRAAEHGRKTPVIVITAKDLARKEEQLLRAMAQGIVRKGNGSVQALLAEVRMMLADGHADSHGTDDGAGNGRAGKHDQ
jgi:PAS domain S-box-containing protein